MRDNRRFQKGHRKGGVYTCRICGRKTRETGESESSCELCAFCFLESGLENSLSDGAITQEQFDTQIIALRQQYRKQERPGAKE